VIREPTGLVVEDLGAPMDVQELAYAIPKGLIRGLRHC